MHCESDSKSLLYKCIIKSVLQEYLTVFGTKRTVCNNRVHCPHKVGVCKAGFNCTEHVGELITHMYNIVCFSLSIVVFERPLAGALHSVKSAL